MKRQIILGFLVIILALAITLPLASSNPDGLEATMEKVGLEEKIIYTAPLSYGESWIEGVLMGLLGVAMVFGTAYLIGMLIKRV
ncbi:cobalt transporter [Pyrococcus furiosus DSM 3638]|uniref:Cobalt transporter n=3 Tax=Pyrococcus furiosus TaxID=2261 RepID=A0A5C0XNI6_PYRFU|nr:MULTISPECIES: PDGLE domain-containing protein [Pyrococcus]AAL80654.1 hypothetical protein PF0530 [Pyrococcus furiosus DSM 3638]AFN03325.1 hypothetical protein PFC_01770 [Pyrococcus furiosus COM1]MDK2870161.1 cobalt/nickel transport protein [Pyrococcus sp.]QEK78242.1 cobalt transporter [Pyrococcus furiosus DSM 3638]